MEKIARQAFLYDFYGDLLTEHQRHVYEDVAFNDMSLGEIAEDLGVSRQAVHDLIKRCDKTLLEYENKLHLVERFMKAKEKVEQIEKIAKDHSKENGSFEDIKKLSDEVLKLL